LGEPPGLRFLAAKKLTPSLDQRRLACGLFNWPLQIQD
jgi:hypothetical protein